MKEKNMKKAIQYIIISIVLYAISLSCFFFGRCSIKTENRIVIENFENETHALYNGYTLDVWFENGLMESYSLQDKKGIKISGASFYQSGVTKSFFRIIPDGHMAYSIDKDGIILSRSIALNMSDIYLIEYLSENGEVIKTENLNDPNRTMPGAESIIYIIEEHK